MFGRPRVVWGPESRSAGARGLGVREGLQGGTGRPEATSIGAHMVARQGPFAVSITGPYAVVFRRASLKGRRGRVEREAETKMDGLDPCWRIINKRLLWL